MKVNDQVIVRAKQLHGNCTELKTGTVVAATVDRVSVAFPGEDFAKSFPLDKVTLADAQFGPGANFDNPYEVPVQKYQRR